MSPEVIKFEKDWWNEINNGCERDQVSFNYAIWKNNLTYKFFSWRNIVNSSGHQKRIISKRNRIKKREERVKNRRKGRRR